jgi:hypothetical protein
MRALVVASTASPVVLAPSIVTLIVVAAVVMASIVSRIRVAWHSEVSWS